MSQAKSDIGHLFLQIDILSFIIDVVQLSRLCDTMFFFILEKNPESPGFVFLYAVVTLNVKF